MMNSKITDHSGINLLLGCSLLVGIVGIVVSMLLGKYVVSAIFAAIPILLITVIYIACYPQWMFYITLVIAYFIIGVTRYANFQGVSILVDGLILFTILIAASDRKLNRGRNISKKSSNILFWGMLVWLVYCILEIVNPTAVTQGWITSRGLFINGFFISLMAVLVVDDFKMIKNILFLLSVLTLCAIVKSLMQKYIGWDSAEARWLGEGGYVTHLLSSGTRYFSFFSDASNFGSNMGFAGVLFLSSAFFLKNKGLKIYYFIVSLLAFYAMFLSGTRGAIIVPAVGFLLMSILSRKVKVFAILITTVVIVFCFFKFTYIGENNQYIRRMRTAFNYEEDGSFNVRKENQKLLGEYLKNKPFGVGIGLSGVENQRISDIYTTSIPNDSWYVKVWVETGIVGFLIYMGILFGAIAQASWRLMFRVKESELRGVLSAWLCGIAGLLVSAYGNAFWGQYPTNVIVFVGLIIALNGEYFQERLKEQQLIKEQLK